METKMMKIKILGEEKQVTGDFLSIYELKFLKDNPRVYACTHGDIENFDGLMPEEQQEIIFKKLLEEPSVKNLLPDIKRHGGLVEPILVHFDTWEVIEGNSRLAVYRKLHSETKEDDWELIPCYIITHLTDQQQAAFLNQIHVTGKTQWSAYEKANFAYVRKEKGYSYKAIAELFGENESTIRTRISVIKMMADNKDSERSHFSYYDVLARNRNIIDGMKNAGGWNNLLADIKHNGPDEEANSFTAQDLRKKLPVVIEKRKVLKKYIDQEINLDEAYQRANISKVEDNVRKAKELLEDITKTEVDALEPNRLNAFKQSFRKLLRETDRIIKMAQEIGLK